MTRPEAFASAAEQLEGTPFRLHGRDPLRGIDCVALVALAMDRPTLAPEGYGLRNSAIAHLLPALAQAGFHPVPPHEDDRRGDLLLAVPGPAQHHFAILLGAGRFIHAHAGLRRTVIQPGILPWPVIGRWRLPDDKD